MIEILGNNLEEAFKELKIVAKRTFKGDSDSEFAEVWALDDANFETLCNVSEEDWKYTYGWWRHAEGANINEVGNVVKMRINDIEIKAYYCPTFLQDFIDECMEEEPEEYTKEELKCAFFDACIYSNFTEYCSTQWQVSNLMNVTAIAIETAKLNEISLSELMSKYQG